VLAVGLYLLLGRPDSFSQQGTAVGQHDVSHEQIEGMVAKLAERLQREPENAQGWGILARSYAAMQRYPESVRAFARYIELVPGDADALADYADALAMTQGRVISGKPLELVKRALQIDPNHWKALAIAGTEAFDRKDYKTAVAYWEKAQRTAPPDSDAAKSLADSVAEARELGGIKSAAKLPESATKPVATVAAVQGTVSLSPALAREVDPADTVFILARAPQGPKMPLAVVKRQVKDLPTTFTLDDTQAMAPGLNISSFPEVVIVARVSKTANAIAQPGDFEGHSSPTRVGSRDVRVVIADRVR
jgi:cytochrome c-type biogenesis protein CcmH